MSCISKKRITQVTIQPGCITCGLCEFIAPDVFEVKDISYVKKDAEFALHANAIKQAAHECPVEVIMYTEKEEKYE